MNKIVQSKPFKTTIQKYQPGTPPYLGNAAVLVDLSTKLRDKLIDALKLTAWILQQTKALERPRTLVARVVELDALRRDNLWTRDNFQCATGYTLNEGAETKYGCENLAKHDNTC